MWDKNESSSSEDDFFGPLTSLLKQKKKGILNQSHPDIRARRVSLPDERAAELCRLFPGVFQYVSGPVRYTGTTQ